MVKRSFFIVLTILFFISSLSGCGIGWTRYTNKEYRFSILLPWSWKKQEGIYNTILLAKSPKTGKNDRFQENITVTITELSSKMDLSTYFELNKEALTQSLASMTNVSEGNIFAGLFAGKYISFEGKMRDLSLKIISAMWMKGKRIYVLSCSSQVRDFAKYKPVFYKILRSLRVK